MKALEGVKVLVTRPEGQAQALVDELERHGAIPLLMPAIRIASVESGSSLEQALSRIGEFDWIVFTSVNGVQAVAKILPALPDSIKIAGIGPATCSAIEEAFRAPDAMPDEYLSEAIAPALGDVSGKRVLLARADIARQELAHILRAKGAVVEEVAAYRILNDEDAPIPATRPDVITVTSSSAATSTFHHLVKHGFQSWATDVPWVCIGPVTAKTARELGCNVAATADEYTISGLVKALIELSLKEKASA